ncbi:MAG: 16S rRNA (cytosine(967)-C(5))-methyltransferase [Cyanobacteria bacterium SID2]|nr:16S rRNA (cytosine(967)-C(5))-methyltransferase [Cyanobacteria bacterium SID2]MBP0006750.1 16S rRNA (cytosine(967)-C(5))-methyltransferase [Cyanobacteria bacterium SBC]
MSNPRQVAFLALKDVYRKGAYADVALDRGFAKSKLPAIDRGLATELVYGCVRRQRSLDAVLDRFAKKPAAQQPPDLRILLHLGLYQLMFLDRMSDAAAVDTTVKLAKENRMAGLSGVVNGVLRQYLRSTSDRSFPIDLPDDPMSQLGIRYSYPDWIVKIWLDRLGFEEAEQLGQWFNRSPQLHLRVNPLKTTVETVETAWREAGVNVERMPHVPQGLNVKNAGNVEALPGYAEGWWTVQDSSAQLVTHLLDPQPGESIVDACAAPGGKTTHIAELMGDTGKIWAIDRTASRLKKVRENLDRLQLNSIEVLEADSRNLPQFEGSIDRVLLDAPCSGLGTLHRRADLRWRQTPETTKELATLQGELLEACAKWVKPGGILVYATCTVNELENENVVQPFLERHPDWQIESPTLDSPVASLATPKGWICVWPHRHQMDGFFMVRLKRR